MTEWEGQVLKECGEPEAWAYGADKDGVIQETLHYLMMYSQDGKYTAQVREVGEWEEITDD